MTPSELKENFTEQLEKLEKEIQNLRSGLAQRQELAIKLQGAIEAMQLQLGETPGGESEEVATAAATEVVEGFEEAEVPTPAKNGRKSR